MSKTECKKATPTGGKNQQKNFVLFAHSTQQGMFNNQLE
jgi:hypothetical protein